MIPGVAQTGAGNPNGGTFYLHGAHFGSQVIEVDGADITAPSQSSILYIQADPEALSDAQVKTAGVDALRAARRRRRDLDLHGLRHQPPAGALASNYQGESWTSNNNPGGTTSAIDLLQTDVSLGGPIVRDRVFFFASHRLVRATPASAERRRKSPECARCRRMPSCSTTRITHSSSSARSAPRSLRRIRCRASTGSNRNESSGGGPTCAPPRQRLHRRPRGVDPVGGSGIWGHRLSAG